MKYSFRKFFLDDQMFYSKMKSTKSKTVRCSGLRVANHKRCSKRVHPDQNGRGWCLQHENQSDTSITTSPYSICSICLDDMIYNNETTVFECGHSFHITCAKNLRDTRCPVCRGPIKSDCLDSEDMDVIQSRSMDDKRERENIFMGPEESDLESSGDTASGSSDSETDQENYDINTEFNIEINRNDSILDVYETLMDNYKQSGDILPVQSLIIGIMGCITITANMLNIADPFEILEDMIIQDMLEMFPNESEEAITNLVETFLP